MPMYVVDVAVALARPPREDRWSRIVLDADTAYEAEVDALHWACRRPGVVMAVRSRVGLLESEPDPADVEVVTRSLRDAVAALRSDR